MDAMCTFSNTIWRRVWSHWTSTPRLWLKPFIESWKLVKKKFLEFSESIRKRVTLICQRNQSLLKIKRTVNKNMPILQWFTQFLSTSHKNLKFPSSNFTKQSFGPCTERNNNFILWLPSNPSCCTIYIDDF